MMTCHRFAKLLGKIIVKGATQMSGHSLKLHFCMFERLEGKHNSLDCHKCFWNIFHQLQSLHVQSLTQIKECFCMFKALKPREKTILVFFQTSFFSTKCAPFLLKIGKDFNIDD
jgi:hypothetical protein